MSYRLPLLALLSLAAMAGPAFAVTAAPAGGRISKGDSYTELGYPYNFPPHTDTCNGHAEAKYTCPNGVIKDCVDVLLIQLPIDLHCTWGPWISNASGFSDTCDGNNNNVYNACVKTCTDLDCTDWAITPLGKKCVNRSRRTITFYPVVPPVYRDRMVKCR